ncbi:hypothetical protein VTL71DRAFT_16023 [Oculimacula yallundae]|uniref:Rhodopsin domain-containing protein n=1 Tax=Oculimacula yallundae TaxID=86028 RepID=A0ABR4CDA5_9HELO
MASTTRTATDLINNGTSLSGAMGTRTDVARSLDEVTSILVMSVLTPVFCMKIFIKRYFGGCCEREDKMLGCAWQFTTMAYCVVALVMAHHGGGNHEWEVPASELMIFQKLLYANTIIYGPAAFFTKTSLLLIFTRVFAHARRAVLFIYVFIGVMACYYVPVLLLKIRICTPIEGLWDPTVEVMCFNQQSIFFTDSVASVVTGMVVLLIPGPLVCTLKVNWCKKCRIAALLGVGGLSTIASIWRALLVWSPTAYSDITVTFVRINLLGIAEISIGMLCACIPTFNLLFTHYAKERRKMSVGSDIPGKQSPDLEMKHLSDDGKKVNIWKQGHKYGVSLGSDVDSIGDQSGERSDVIMRGSKSVDIVEDVRKEEPQKRQEMSELQRKSLPPIVEDAESQAGSESGGQRHTRTETEGENDTAARSQRRRSSEEVPDWPLSGGGAVEEKQNTERDMV